MQIAVAGAGIAGSTAAWRLQQAGHHVTLFEQAEKCHPVGAGIMLQPSGQAVLHELGLLDDVVRDSSRIGRLHAKHQNGRTLVDLQYQRLSCQACARGVRRSVIFRLLFKRCQNEGVRIMENTRLLNISQDGNVVHVVDGVSNRHGPFDLLIAADGSASTLRQASGIPTRIKEYQDAALWVVGPWSGDETCLQQLVGRDGRLVGILPVGGGECSFFWGLRKSEEKATREAGLQQWQAQVAEFCPAASEIVGQLQSMDDVIFSSYRNARMSRVIDRRVVWIGDSAHATSPHLGQGLNLALQDSLALVRALQSSEDIDSALADYESARSSTTAFYGRLTGWLTPFFQTPNRLLQFGRDLALPVMPRLPWIGTQMLLTMAGMKTGWLADQREAIEALLNDRNDDQMEK
ncbi:MAG TPA: FAD-dependent monooxygenase [Planctomycetaceae bacterium]|nr:FAD-dependent monooxygenase [Planctomycetaceae bacterium]